MHRLRRAQLLRQPQGILPTLALRRAEHRPARQPVAQHLRYYVLNRPPLLRRLGLEGALQALVIKKDSDALHAVLLTSAL